MNVKRPKSEMLKPVVGSEVPVGDPAAGASTEMNLGAPIAQGADLLPETATLLHGAALERGGAPDLMAPQIPMARVPVSVEGLLSPHKAPRDITKAEIVFGKLRIVLDDIQNAKSGDHGTATLQVPGHEPYTFSWSVRGTRTQDAWDTACGLVKNCSEWARPESLARGSLRSAEFFQAASEAAQTPGAYGPVRDLRVTRFGEQMSFTFDRSEPGAGHAVRLDGLYPGLSLGAIGIADGQHGHDQAEALVTFGASAHMDDRIVSCSGGPVPYITLADLQPTGETVTQQFWRWRDGIAMADNAEYYALEVPLWSWKGSAKSIFEKMDREEFKAALESLHVRYPGDWRDGEWVSTRKDCAHLSLRSGDGAPGGLHGNGFITAPFAGMGTAAKREFFEAEIALGYSELVGFSVGRTWEECLDNLKSELLSAYDAMKEREATDPIRVEHSRMAAKVFSEVRTGPDRQQMYDERAQVMIRKMVEEAGPRQFSVVVLGAEHGQPIAASTRLAFTATEALCDLAAPRLEDGDFPSLDAVDRCEVAGPGIVTVATALSPLPRPELGERHR